MESSRSVIVPTQIKLNGPNDYDEWILQTRRYFTTLNVWQYADPSIDGKVPPTADTKAKIPKEPQSPNPDDFPPIEDLYSSDSKKKEEAEMKYFILDRQEERAEKFLARREKAEIYLALTVSTLGLRRADREQTLNGKLRVIRSTLAPKDEFRR
jgi:hypothetical protein